MRATLRSYWYVEAGIPLRALRFVASGFRARRGSGFSYDRNGILPVVLVALAVITVPQAFAFDLLLGHAPIARIVSAVLHAYAIVWTLAIAHAVQTEMHEVNATAATFRFPLLRSMTVPRELIVAVRVVDERPRNVTRLGLGRTGLLIELREPLFVTQPFMRPCAQRLFVGADDPHALAAALAVRESAKPER